jgi:hypothetical protein
MDGYILIYSSGESVHEECVEFSRYAHKVYTSNSSYIALKITCKLNVSRYYKTVM